MTISNQVDAAEYARLTQQQKPRKYRNVPVELDGYQFDSKAEATRYGELKLLERSGEIRDLEVHTRWPLTVNGVTVANYECDFEYVVPSHYDAWADFWHANKTVVEDVKPAVKERSGKRPYTGRTAVYRLKAKLFMAIYGWPITEVER